MSAPLFFRVVTYNVHKCVGMDRHLSPGRIAEVIGETKGDVVALQEVVRTGERRRGGDQMREIAKAAGFSHCCFGENRPHWNGAYGNAILSRWPIARWHNHDISISGKEPRGMLQADIMIAGSVLLHVLNLHMGTGYLERRRQVERLLGEDALLIGNFEYPRILLGDFNEWTRGMATRRLAAHMQSAERTGKVRSAKRLSPKIRSYPGVLPVMHLDHIYYDPPLQLRNFEVHRTRLARLASDHLPLIADFELEC